MEDNNQETRSETRSEAQSESRSEESNVEKRIRKLAQERDNWMAKASEFEEQLMTTKASVKEASKYRDELEAVRAEYESFKSQADERFSLYKAGLSDDEALEAARFWYSRDKSEDKPSIVDWIEKQKSDPENAHQGLRPFLVSSDAEVSKKRTPDQSKAKAKTLSEPKSKILEGTMTDQEYLETRKALAKQR